MSLMVAAVALSAGCGTKPLASPALLTVWGESGDGQGALRQPTGIAVGEDGSVFVADAGNHRIQVFDANGGFVREIGSRGTGTGQFLRPMDLDLDSQGRLYVAEHGGDRVQVFARDGTFLRVVRGDDSVAGSFDAAAGVLISPDDELYVADFYNNRIVVFRPDGSFERIIGAPGRVLPGRLHYPTDLDWIAPSTDGGDDGRLLVADAYNNRIQLFTPDGKAVARWGGLFGLGIPGSAPGSFRVAIGVAVDASNRIYVADFENHRIQVFTDHGRHLSTFGSRGTRPGEFERPTDLAIGPDGRIFVVDFGNDRVQVFERLPDPLD